MEDNSEVLLKYQKLAHEYSKVINCFIKIITFNACSMLFSLNVRN